MKIIEKEMQEEGKEYVYIAEFVGGFCKIGVSNNPIKRLRGVSRKNQIPLKDYFLVDGYLKLEKYLHNHFKEKRRYSEWFELDFNEVRDYLEKLDINIKEFKENYYNVESEIKENKNTFMIGIHKKIFDNFDIWEKEVKIEEDFNKTINKQLTEISVFMENGFKVKQETLKECITNLIYYNIFLENLKIKIGDEEEIINSNIKTVCELSKIATFIEFTDTNNMTDKEVYAMVKAHIEK